MEGTDNTPAIELRPGRLEDAAGIASLGSSVFTASFAYSMVEEDLATYLRDSYNVSRIADEIQDPRIHFLVAVADRKVMGFVQLNESSFEDCISELEKPIELQRLYVHESQQGRGLARKLTDAIESVAKEKGYKNLWLGVWEDNYKAQNFYKKMGLSRIGEHPFTMGKTVQTDWIMSKAL